MAAQENIQRDMGNRIAKRRTELGLSQESLAELAGMSRVSVVRIENGEQAPRSNTAEKLCKVLQDKMCQCLLSNMTTVKTWILHTMI